MKEAEQPRIATSILLVRSRFRKFLLVALISLIGFTWLFFFLSRSSVPPAVLLSLEDPVPSSLNRFKGLIENWSWQARDRFFGARKQLQVDSVVLKLPEDAAANRLSALLSDPVFHGTNGLKIWVVPNEKISEVTKRSSDTILALPPALSRLLIADAVPSSIWVGRSFLENGMLVDEQFTTEISPRLRLQGADLKFKIASIEDLAKQSNPSLKNTTNMSFLLTNFSVSARVRLPKNFGVIFLIPSQREDKTSYHAVLFSATYPPQSR